MEHENLNKSETPNSDLGAVSGSAFDFETNFITCKCEGEKELYIPNLGDGGYDWCKKCNCPLGDY